MLPVYLESIITLQMQQSYFGTGCAVKDFIYVAGSFNNWQTQCLFDEKDPTSGKFWLNLQVYHLKNCALPHSRNPTLLVLPMMAYSAASILICLFIQ
jgi:hypothetical protein